MPFDDLSTPLKLIYAAWFAAVGGAIGSFLNVVVYRVPAGLGLIYPASHCPACKHLIRWHDNVPVLGWFRLRGRCRDCGARISVRYPIVEALTAGMFFVLGWADVLGGAVHPQLGAAELLGICLYHLLLLCTLLAAALIEGDGHWLPIRVVAPALLVGLLAPVAWPYLHPMPAWQGLDGWTAGLVDGLVGLAVGLAVGWAIGRAAIGRHRPGLLGTAACVGLMLGYQAVLVIALVLLAILLLQALLKRLWPAWPVVPPTAWLAVLTFVWALAWKSLL